MVGNITVQIPWARRFVVPWLGFMFVHDGFIERTLIFCGFLLLFRCNSRAAF